MADRERESKQMEAYFVIALIVCAVVAAVALAVIIGADEAKDTAQSTARDTHYAEIEAQAIRRLGARGAISQDDANRIAREHVDRMTTAAARGQEDEER